MTIFLISIRFSNNTMKLNDDGKISNISSNPQPIGFRGILLVKRQKFILLYIFLAQQKCRRHKIPLPHKAT